MNKKAFTIPEILIFIGIVGIICVMMITTIKPSEKYLKFAYYNAYNVLATSGYNVVEDASENMERFRRSEPGIPPADIVFPNDDAKEFCKKFATSSTASVNSAAAKYGYINTTVYNCDKAGFNTVTVSNPTTQDAQFTDANLAFVATNSMRFYITKQDFVSVPNLVLPGTDLSIQYYVVWVDLNGQRGPNSAISKKGRAADIVAFAVTRSGKVLPLGNPTVDTRYMIARIVYPVSSKTAYSDQVRTFYQTQLAAFGTKEYPATDQISVRKSLIDKYSSKSLQLDPKLIPATPAIDAKCGVASDAVSTACSVEIEPQKAL